MASGNNDTYIPVALGIKPKATKAWMALMNAQDEHQHYPCLNNPYLYMDYNGSDSESPERIWLSVDDCEALCYGCPIIKQCHDFAVANEETNGVWGGIDMSVAPDSIF